ncbi:1-phosphofructokinase [Priestia megaterium]|uniref:1-phosphofructokinase n=1 Tax=Priestia megaterium TaxID=1404 RepID=UPI0030005014
MITTITLNAAVDKSYYMNDFKLDKVNRVKELLAVPGGKGINVAKVAHTLGAQVVASGFLGGVNGQFIHQSLQQLGIISDFAWVKGNSRETIAIIEAGGSSQTELLEPGPIIDEEAQYKLENKISELSHGSKVVSFSGSIPRGLPYNIYTRLIQIAKKHGAITILDTSGSYLSHGLEGKPDICKPNLEELEQCLGYRPNGKYEVVKAAKQLIDKGIKLVIVSMDKEGALAVTNQSAWSISPPRIKVKNTVGCGDSMVAAIAYYLDRLVSPPTEEDIEKALRLGTATAASNALHQIAGSIQLDEVNYFTSMVTLKKL